MKKKLFSVMNIQKMYWKLAYIVTWFKKKSQLFPQKYAWVMGKYDRKYHMLLLSQANNCYSKAYVEYYRPFIHKLFYFMPV